jgi:hypothetical protein
MIDAMYGLTYGRKLLLAGAAVLALTVPVVIGLVDVASPQKRRAYSIVEGKSKPGQSILRHPAGVRPIHEAIDSSGDMP